MPITSPGMVTTAEIRSQFEAASREGELLVRQLDASQFNWKSSPERWSIGQCIDHLNTAGELVANNLESALNGRSPAWLAGLLAPFERAFVRTMRPGSSVKVPSPRTYRPASSNIDPADALERFGGLQQRMAALLIDYESRGNLNRVIRSPVTPLLWLSAAAWFEVTAVHQQRHLDQARRVLEDPHFPPSA